MRMSMEQIHQAADQKDVERKDTMTHTTVSMPIAEWIRICNTLEVVPDVTQTTFDVICAKVEHLQSSAKTQADLLEALEELEARYPNNVGMDKARKAIQKARGG